MKKIIPIVAIIILILAFFLLRGREDSEFFESYFNEMIETGKAKEPDGFMDNFSLQYKDDYGANYIYIKQIVKNYFEKYDEFESVFENLIVSTSEDEFGDKIAEVNMDLFVTGFRDGIPVEIVGESGHLENITVALKKSTLGGWKITTIDGIDKAENFQF